MPKRGNGRAALATSYGFRGGGKPFLRAAFRQTYRAFFSQYRSSTKRVPAASITMRQYGAALGLVPYFGPIQKILRAHGPRNAIALRQCAP